jgi:hypothetical protein
MLSASVILGTLISIECRLGTMFISLASGCRLCFNHISFVALIFVLSGSTNTFRTGGRCHGNNPRHVWHPRQMCSLCPVYQICSLVFFSILQLFCSATLRIENQLLLTESDQHLCALLLHLPALQQGRKAGTNNCYFCLQGFLLHYLLLGFTFSW